MHVNINGVPCNFFPCEPRPGHRIQIDGQIVVIDSVVIDAHHGAFDCTAKPEGSDGSGETAENVSREPKQRRKA